MGDNGVYGLGVLELRLADVDVNLRLSSEITIAPSAEDDRNDIDAYGKSKDIFYGDGIRKPWAIRSHEYQVRVDLTLASGLEFQDETFTQQVAVKLKHLEARIITHRCEVDTNMSSGLAEPRVRGHIGRDLFK